MKKDYDIIIETIVCAFEEELFVKALNDINLDDTLSDSEKKQKREKYLRENKFTNKGIYFTLKYFYEVRKNSWDKGHGGIGIVPYTYKEATEYWTEQERKQRGFVNAIEQQLKERAARETKVIKRQQKKKVKAKYYLSDIGGI